MKPVIVYSHGFGVRRDDRGLFTDIAAALPEYKHIMFDYNHVDTHAKTMSVLPFEDQAKLLEAQLTVVRSDYPNQPISIVAHSQGGTVAALAQLGQVERAILITPPVWLNTEQIIATFGSREGSVIDPTGISRLARRDGSTTIVPANYLASLERSEPLERYMALARKVDTTLIQALEDEVLGETDLSSLEPTAHVVRLHGSHDFSGSARTRLTAEVAGIMKQ